MGLPGRGIAPLAGGTVRPETEDTLTRHMLSLEPFAAPLLFAVALPLGAGDAPLQGIELSDINRSVDACTDFYEFANGSWRAKNPIPAEMPRWSRRWAAGETSKDRLKGILEEAAAAKSSPKGSVEQLIGDFYGACMDEAEIDRLGARPLDPL